MNRSKFIGLFDKKERIHDVRFFNSHGAGGFYSGCIFRGFCGTDDAQILLSDAQVRLCHAGGGHH